MPQLHPLVLCKFCVRLSPGNICPGENLATGTGCILLLLPLPLLPFFAAPAPACPLLCIKHSSCCSLAAANPFIFPGFISSLLMGAGSSLSKLPLFNLPWQGSPFQLRSERAQRRGRKRGFIALYRSSSPNWWKLPEQKQNNRPGAKTHCLQVPWVLIHRDLSSAGGVTREGRIQAVPACALPQPSPSTM